MTSIAFPARARRLVGLLLTSLLLLLPSPAHAWFGWLDEWSGPGPFWGALFDVRLACFGEQRGLKQLDGDGEALFTALRQLEVQPAGTSREQLAAALGVAQQKWQALIRAFEKLQVPTAALTELLDEPLMRRRTVGENDAPVVAKEAQAFLKIGKPIVTKDTDQAFHAAVAQVSIGTLWSLCPAEVERQVSIELNVNTWKTRRDDQRFAGGQGVRLVTVMPSVTWRVIANDKYDLVDAGIAAGVYTFTSSQFQSFSGFMLEPLRIDVHAPTSWNNGTPWQRAVALFAFRWSYLMAPAGFDPNVFAGPGGVTPRIPSEMTNSRAIFFNLKPLLYKR